MDLLSIPDYCIKGDLTGTVTGRSQETRNTTLPINSRRSEKSTTRVSTIDLYEMTNSAGIWFKLVEPKIFVVEWTPQEVDNYKSNWWIRSNKIGFRYHCNPARIWLQTSIVYLAAIERKRSSTKPTKDTKLFFVLVELERNIVDSLFLRKSPWRRTQYWLIRATW